MSRPHRILIVEDERLVAEDLAECLRASGYAVAGIAGTGIEAVEMAHTQKPDLIIMDIILKQGMDGVAAARKIREVASIPVVYLTAYTDRATLDRAKKTEPFGYLVKPFSEAELQTTIETALYKASLEVRLKESEQRLDLALTGADLGLWDWEVESGALLLDARWARLLDYDPHEVGTHVDWWEGLIHPDDLRRVKESLDRRLGRNESVYQSEHRLVTKWGRWKWIFSRGKVVAWDGDGRPLRVTGVSQDVTPRKTAEEGILRAREELEQRVRERTDELVRANEQLEAEIEERKKAEEALRASEARFRQLAELLPQMVYELDADGRFLFINRAGLEIGGFTAEDFKAGLDIFTVLPPEDHDRARENVKRAASGGAAVNSQYTLISKDGARVPVEAYSSPIRERGRIVGIRGVAVDITERLRNEEALRQSEEKYRRLFEESRDAIVVTTLDGEYEAVNDAFLEMVGCRDSEELAGYKAQDFYANPEDRESMREEIARIDGGKEFEFTFRKIDGTKIDTVQAISPRRGPDGAIMGYQGIIRDVTERKRYEVQLAEELKKFQALHGLAVAMTLERSLDENLLLVVETARDLLGTDTSGIALHDLDRNEAYMRAHSGLRSDGLKSVRVPCGEGLGGEATRTGRPAVTYDYFEEVGSAYKDLLREEGLISGLAAPIQLGSETLGVLYAFNRTNKAFSHSDVETLSLLGNLAAVEITRRRAEEALRTAHHQMERRVEERTAELRDLNRQLVAEIAERSRAEAELEEEIKKFAALYEVAVAMTARQSLEENLSLVVEKSRDVLGSDAAFIALGEERSKVLRMRILSGIRTQEFRDLELPIGKGIGGHVTGAGSGYIVEDYFDEPHPFYEETVRREGLVSGIAVPIQVGPANLGALYIANRRKQQYSLKDLDTLSLFGNLAAIEITRKRAEKDLERALAASIQLRAEAEAANRTKSEFLATMSHELRTPLTAIIGFSEILEDRTFGPMNERQMRSVGHVLSSGRHLFELINQILDLSKIESGKMELKVSPVNIRHLLQGSLGMIKEKSMKHGLEVSLKIEPEDLVHEIPVDELKLKQIMFNLLSNAAKFTPDGGRISVHALVLENRLEISVTDTGIGIDPADQERIFDAFEQVDSSYGRKQSGTGLGLALTRKLVEMHHGRIRVESKGDGTGSRFAFHIPLSGEAREEAPSEPRFRQRS